MKDASGQTVSIDLGATTAAGADAGFRASGTVITFPGFLLAYESGRDEPATQDDEERRLPALTVGQELTATALDPQGHETSPPARYTEASLVKALEDRGIGRPSTYASIMGTILDRGYVYKKGTALVPTFLAFAVTQLLERHFDQLVDYDFTARLEDDLDRIAAGGEERVDVAATVLLRRRGDPGLQALVTDHLEGIDAREVNSIEIPGSDIVARVGRYGPYLERGESRASLPEDLAPDELTAGARGGAARAAGGRGSVARDASGDGPRDRRPRRPVRPVRDGGAPGGRRVEAADGVALRARWSPRRSRLEDAVLLLTLPRTLEGTDGAEIVVANGRYGPFVKKGSETRSLASEEQLLTITVEEAEEILAQPKERRGRGAAKPPAEGARRRIPGPGSRSSSRTAASAPTSPTARRTRASARATTPRTLTLERALELLAERRAKGPATPPQAGARATLRRRRRRADGSNHPRPPGVVA